MRADRLLSILMLLQTHGRMTARALADELEVSERTIYRDIEALSTAGVPVYAERGPGGGCALLDSYRTNLTGLNADEVRALFMVSIPAPLADLGVSQELKAAMRKLTAALPDGQRSQEEHTRQRIYLDSSWWRHKEDTPPHLHTLHQAVWKNQRVRILYWPEYIPRNVQIEHHLEPYGLVAKASIWYLVAGKEGAVQVFRVSRILEAELCGEYFERPADFDLAACWNGLCLQFECDRPVYPVTLRVAPEVMLYLPHYLGDRADAIQVQGQPDGGGWTTVDLSFENHWEARTFILGMGRAVEVLAPEVLRLSVIDYAGQIVNFYGESHNHA